MCIREKAHQMRDESLDELCTGAHQAVELRAVGQSGESVAQVSLGVAVEIPLAGETAPTSKDGQGYDLALGEGRLGARPPFWRLGVAEVVDHNVEYGEEGVHIEHKESVPFPSGSGSKPTLIGGHLPLKFRSNNSHQAFKGPVPSHSSPKSVRWASKATSRASGAVGKAQQKASPTVLKM